MQLAFGLTALALAATAAAVPNAVVPRATAAGPCDGLGEGAFDTFSNFTFAAYNTTGTNTNSTGAPLVMGQAGATSGASFKALSTWASYPYNDYPTPDLVNGTLMREDGIGSLNVQSGSQLSFIVSSLIDPTQGAKAYCGVANVSSTRFSLLAANGAYDLFSLCKVGTQSNVIFNATSEGTHTYDISTCYPVFVQIIPNAEGSA